MKRLLKYLFVMISGVAFAQDPEFTQFYAAPLYLNPALAGSTRCPRINVNYRDQWPALKGTFVTTAASYDQYVDVLQGGLGIMVVNDQAGQNVFNTINASAIYSYQLNISREVAAKVGFQATFAQKKFDFSSLRFGDKIDNRYGFIYNSSENQGVDTRIYPDFSVGTMVYTSYLYGGFAVHHITQPSQSFLNSANDDKLPIKYTVHFGTIIGIGADKKNPIGYLSPNVLFRQQQGTNQLNLGLYAGRGPFITGFWYRGNINNYENFFGSDSFIILAGIQQGIFKIGYSYDLTVSRLSDSSSGSHEISLGIQFECSPKKKKFKAIKCPVF